MEAMKSLRYLIIIGIVILTPVFAWSSDKGAWQWIDSARLQNMLKEGSSLWLIDIRNQHTFASGHIEGAINIPAEALKIRSFPQNRMLVLADDSLGLRSARETADALTAKGYEKVYLLEGGIAAWKLEGYPYVESSSGGRGVTAGELKWALANNVSLKIYDMRDGVEREKGKIQAAEPIQGKSMDERIEGLKTIMKSRTSGDLASRLKKIEPLILVFSASDDVAAQIRKIQAEVKDDIRYLIGGYESFEDNRYKHVKMLGACPTCTGR